MLEYDRIDMSKRIDVDKTSESRKCIICNYYYFHKVNFRFKPKVSDSCHDLKVQSCKLYENKYKIASTHITNTETVTFIAVLVFQLLRRHNFCL